MSVHTYVTWLHFRYLSSVCVFKSLSFFHRKQFVAAFVNHAFNASVERVFEEFKRGFFKVCDMNLVDFFQPEELQAVMVGQEDYDWEVFKQVCWNEWFRIVYIEKNLY